MFSRTGDQERAISDPVDVFFPSFSLAQSSPRDLPITAFNKLLQIIFCSFVIETTLLCENGDRLPKQAENGLTCLVDQKNGDGMIKQLINSVIPNY